MHFASSLQTEAEQGQCKIESVPDILTNDNCAGPADGLCGNVPVQYGPQYANPLEPGSEGEEPTVIPSITDVAPVPTQSYAPARSKITDKWGGGISVYNVKPSALAAEPAPAAPAITPAADINDAPKSDADGSIVSTTTYTLSGTVYEVAIKEVIQTVTVEAAYKNKLRRHAHVHRRDREHGLLKGH